MSTSDLDATRFVASRGMTLALRGPGEFEARLNGTGLRLGRDALEILLELATPRTPAAVLAARGTDPTRFRALLETLCAAGLVTPVPDAPEVSILELLAPDLRANRGLVTRVGDEIAAGRAVVLPDAFDRGLAQRMRTALDASQAWSLRLQSTPDRPYFQYRHFGIYELANLPADVRALEQILCSPATRTDLRTLTGCDCDGPFDFGAAAYHTGDFSYPHNDCNGRRSLSFIWYLTDDWRPEWGGQFVWCPTGAMVNPAFNTLIIFQVTEQSLHFVTRISHLARARRLSITGFWQRADPHEPRPAPRAALAGVDLCTGLYGAPTECVDDRLVVL